MKKAAPKSRLFHGHQPRSFHRFAAPSKNHTKFFARPAGSAVNPHVQAVVHFKAVGQHSTGEACWEACLASFFSGNARLAGKSCGPPRTQARGRALLTAFASSGRNAVREPRQKRGMLPLLPSGPGGVHKLDPPRPLTTLSPIAKGGAGTSAKMSRTQIPSRDALLRKKFTLLKI